MTEPFPPATARDTFVDLNEQIGNTKTADAQLRLACFRTAMECTRLYEKDAQLAEILFAARRITRFVIEGTTPTLQIKVGEKAC